MLRASWFSWSGVDLGDILGPTFEDEAEKVGMRDEIKKQVSELRNLMTGDGQALAKAGGFDWCHSCRHRAVVL
jgi:hypothetical protein